MAHEVAHLFFRDHFLERYWYENGFWEFEPETQGEKNFQLSVLAGIKDLHEICFGTGNFDEENPTDTTNQILAQVNELVCDTLSAFVCGPSQLFTFSEIVDILLPFSGDYSLKDLVRYVLSHPPFDARLAALVNSLKFTNILPNDKHLSTFTDSLFKQCQIKNSNLIDLGEVESQDIDFLKKYINFAKGLALDLLDTFYQMDIKFFSEAEWLTVKKSLEKGIFYDLTPVQFSNLIWLKRFSIISTEKYIDFLEYGTNRSSEKKIFEETVNCNFKYYEKTVFPEVTSQ